jgi:hypothetical protein
VYNNLNKYSICIPIKHHKMAAAVTIPSQARILWVWPCYGTVHTRTVPYMYGTVVNPTLSGVINVLLERAVIQGLTSLFGCHSGLVQTGSDQFYKIISLPEPRTRPKVRFMPWCELWSRLWSGLQNFRLELWFRTELWHHYGKQLEYFLSWTFHDSIISFSKALNPKRLHYIINAHCSAYP